MQKQLSKQISGWEYDNPTFEVAENTFNRVSKGTRGDSGKWNGSTDDPMEKLSIGTISLEKWPWDPSRPGSPAVSPNRMGIRRVKFIHSWMFNKSELQDGKKKVGEGEVG